MERWTLIRTKSRVIINESNEILIAMLKSIKILLYIVSHYDYEIWQMNAKTAFLNGNFEEEIYMMQPEGFIAKNQEHMVCKLKRSIYELKHASRSWNIRFDQAIKSFSFEQNLDEPCVYKRHQDKVVMFIVLYVDDILLIGNDVGGNVINEGLVVKPI